MAEILETPNVGKGNIIDEVIALAKKKELLLSDGAIDGDKLVELLVKGKADKDEQRLAGLYLALMTASTENNER